MKTVRVSISDFRVSPPGHGAQQQGHGGQGQAARSSSSKAVDPSRHEDSEESGVGHEEEEEIQQLIVELLSNMRTPRVRKRNYQNFKYQTGKLDKHRISILKKDTQNRENEHGHNFEPLYHFFFSFFHR